LGDAKKRMEWYGLMSNEFSDVDFVVREWASTFSPVIFMVTMGMIIVRATDAEILPLPLIYMGRNRRPVFEYALGTSHQEKDCGNNPIPWIAF